MKNKTRVHVYVVHIENDAGYRILGVYDTKNKAEAHRDNITSIGYISVTRHTVRGASVLI